MLFHASKRGGVASLIPLADLPALLQQPLIEGYAAFYTEALGPDVVDRLRESDVNTARQIVRRCVWRLAERRVNDPDPDLTDDVLNAVEQAAALAQAPEPGVFEGTTVIDAFNGFRVFLHHLRAGQRATARRTRAQKKADDRAERAEYMRQWRASRRSTAQRVRLGISRAVDRAFNGDTAPAYAERLVSCLTVATDLGIPAEELLDRALGVVLTKLDGMARDTVQGGAG